MEQGWIKIHRKFPKWGWYQKSEMVHLFLHLLLSANHEDGEWQGHKVKRGQLITGLHKLQQNTGISIQTLRTCLDKLKSTGEITNKSTNKFRVITIVKYEEYQMDERKLTSKSTNKLTNNQQTTNKQLTTNNNNKEIKNNILSSGEDTGKEKNKSPLQEKKTPPFDFKTTLDKMKTNVKQKHIQVIALYWHTLGIEYENEDQYQVQLKRNLKPAQLLKGYSFQDIKATMEYLETETDGGQKYKWTLETVLKYIDEVKQKTNA